MLAAALLALTLCAGAGASTLQKGSKGDDVAAVQRQLIDMGFLTGEADGIFGSQTAAAVKAFQKYEGYKQTGKLSDAQRAELQTLWNIATDTSYISYGGGSEDLRGVYDDTCALHQEEGGPLTFSYCWRHYKAEANLNLLRLGPMPAQLEMMLAGNACRYWEQWILQMYDEWEGRLSKSQKKIARQYKADFQDDLQRMRADWQARQPLDQPNWALVQEANWLEEVGVQMCMDQNGMEPQGK